MVIKYVVYKWVRFSLLIKTISKTNLQSAKNEGKAIFFFLKFKFSLYRVAIKLGIWEVLNKKSGVLNKNH